MIMKELSPAYPARGKYWIIGISRQKLFFSRQKLFFIHNETTVNLRSDKHS